MEATVWIGVLMYVLGGASGASFYLPFKGVKDWPWAKYWLVYSLAALLIVPWALTFWLSPNTVGVLRETPANTLLWCFLFGAMWGAGGLTWGLMIRYLGVGLGLAIGCGLCAAFGTLVPPIFKGEFQGLLDSDSGKATLIGVGVCLLGIILTGAAGMSKERELSEEEKKSTVAEFNFTKGILVAIFSGIMSASMSFGLDTSQAISDLTQKVEPKTAALWQGLPGLAVVLLGGFATNCLWCMLLIARSRPEGQAAASPIRLPVNLTLSSIAGIIWYSQFLFFIMGATKIGAYKFSGWSLLMSSQILFSTLWGIALLEWRGSSRRTRLLLVAGLFVLVASLVVIGYGNYLKRENP